MANEHELTDPRIARTRRDVITVAADVLLRQGWEHVSHAEVARQSGYSKATIYTHWPQRIDLVRDAVDRICDQSHHPDPTGDTRADLIGGLADFAADLSTGQLARVVGGVIERSGTDPVIDGLRARLYAAGTAGLRRILEGRLPAEELESLLALLTGAVFMRVTFAAEPADEAFVADLVDRVVPSGLVS